MQTIDDEVQPAQGTTCSGKLEILFILPDLSGGGAERTVVNLLRYIDRERFTPYLGLLSPQGEYLHLVNQADIKNAPLPGWLRHTLDLPSNSIHSMHFWTLLPRVMRIPVSIYQIRALIRTIGPDVVLTSMTGLNILTHIALSGLKEHSICWIAREGNNFVANLRQLVKSQLLQQLFLTIIKHCYSQADHVLTLSQGSAEEMAHDFGIAPTRVSWIYNPIHLHQIRQTLQTKPANNLIEGRYIVAVGRLHPQKGFEDLLKALKRCHQHYQLNDLQLIIIGEGNHRSVLEEQIQALNLQHYVKLVGFVNNPWSYVAAAQIFVLPSLWEGFAHVVVEAMACQTPVIATDCDYGPKEIIVDQETGLLTLTHNPEQLAAAIHQLLTHPEKAKRLVQNAAIRAEDFDAAKITRQYERLFGAVCSLNGKRQTV
ncbi:MAG: glycosyltransferase [Leptolyngbyaceae cyanobacterium MO_188.B28]|nr:glycosyltransferase [Leptolyngbyaceae cyanobacterium MO_188.B28]